MWRNYMNCKGSSALSMLLWWFMLLLVHTASPMKSKTFICAFWPAWTLALKFFQHSECCFAQHCWQGRLFFYKPSGCIFPISNIFQNNAKILVQDTHTHTARAAMTWTPQLIKFQHLDWACSQLNSTHTNHHTSTSQYNIFLSSITRYIWRVASLRLMLLVCGGKKYIQELLVLHACWTSTIRMSKDFTWWTVCVCVCVCVCMCVCTYVYMYVCVCMCPNIHTQTTFVVLSLQCSCTIKLTDKLHTLCLQLHIHYFHYLFKIVPLVATVMYLGNR